MLHHPWYMTDKQIDNFHNIINDLCIQYNFSGIHLIINNINRIYTKYLNYNFHINYSTTYSNFIKNEKCYINYRQYITDDINTKDSDINTLVFDFDNTNDIFNSNKVNNSTICMNNCEYNKITFINKIVESYNKKKKSDVENILLINAWNEWDKKMAIEPSEEYGYYYLNLITKYVNNTNYFLPTK